MKVRQLPPEVIKKLRSGIAITSVVHCVDELISNSIDAGSTCIAVRLNLPFYKVQVIDNGEGIPIDQFDLIGERYATSKCFTVSDLENLRSGGFRGESLASLKELSSVLTVESRYKSSNQTCFKMFCQKKAVKTQKSINDRASHGTTVTICDFMYNMPVRKQGISEALDLEECRRLLERTALMYPHVSLSLRSDATGEICLETRKWSSLHSAFSFLYGREKSQHAKEVHFIESDLKVSGLISSEGHTSKDLQLIFVNKRFIHRCKLHKLVHSMLKQVLFTRQKNQNTSSSDSPQKNQCRFGMFVLNISCPYNKCDISFQPRKTSVLFTDEEKILHSVERTVIEFFLNNNYLTIPEQESEIKSSMNLCSGKESYAISSDFGKRINIQDANKFLTSLPAKRHHEKKINENLESKKACLEESRVLNVDCLNVPCISQNSIPDDMLQNLTRNGNCSSKESITTTREIQTSHLVQTRSKSVVCSNKKMDNIPSRTVFPNSNPVMVLAPVKYPIDELIEKTNASSAFSSLMKQFKFNAKEPPAEQNKVQMMDTNIQSNEISPHTKKISRFSFGDYSNLRNLITTKHITKSNHDVASRAHMMKSSFIKYLEHSESENGHIKIKKSDVILSDKKHSCHKLASGLQPMKITVKPQEVNTVYDNHKSTSLEKSKCSNSDKNVHENFKPFNYFFNDHGHFNNVDVAKQKLFISPHKSDSSDDIIQDFKFHFKKSYINDIAENTPYYNFDKDFVCVESKGIKNGNNSVFKVPMKVKACYNESVNCSPLKFGFKNDIFIRNQSNFITDQSPYFSKYSRSQVNSKLICNWSKTKKRKTQKITNQYSGIFSKDYITSGSKDIHTTFVNESDTNHIHKNPIVSSLCMNNDSASSKFPSAVQINSTSCSSSSVPVLCNVDTKEIIEEAKDEVSSRNVHSGENSDNTTVGDTEMSSISKNTRCYNQDIILCEDISTENSTNLNPTFQSIENDCLLDGINVHPLIYSLTKEKASEVNINESDSSVYKNKEAIKELPEINQNFTTDFQTDKNLSANYNNHSIINKATELPVKWSVQTDPVNKKKIYIDLSTGNSSYYTPQISEAGQQFEAKAQYKSHFFLTHNASLFMGSPVSLRKQVINESLAESSELQGIIHDADNLALSIKWRDIQPSYAAKTVGDMFQMWENPMFQQPTTEMDDMSLCQKKMGYNILNMHRFTKKAFTDMKVIGQVDKKFIACIMHNINEEYIGKNLLVLFDQHAVHERIRLEQLMKELYETDGCSPKQVKSVSVSPPLSIKLDAGQTRLLEKYSEHLMSFGVKVEKCPNSNVFQVQSVPACLVGRINNELKKKQNGDTCIAILIQEWLFHLEQTKSVTSLLPKTIVNVLNSKACKGAVKFGDYLDHAECVTLMESLSSCNLPFQCAHGRPSVAPIVDLCKIQHSEKEFKPQYCKLGKHTPDTT